MRKIITALLISSLVLGLAACGGSGGTSSQPQESTEGTSTRQEETSAGSGTDDSAQSSIDSGAQSQAAFVSDKEYIEYTLNLANNEDQEWTYDQDSDAWILSIVTAVVYPEIVDQQGVSACVPGAYVTGIDTDGDGSADITSADAPGAVKGSLVIDYDAAVTSTNGQVYTASTAPVIINTGAAGYGSSTNTAAATTYAAEGYINISCGNRGKQDTAVDEAGNTYYTGDAPSCLTDQKNAARFVRYNILLGNLPGSTDYFVSTGGSGGGAHAVMFAATSDNPDFYDYQEAAGAVGVYLLEDGSFQTSVTIDGTDYEISDGAWGCMAYSPITSLYEADMAMAFEYYLDADYSFGSSFQKAMAGYLAESYMDYINSQELTVAESAVGFDLNADGDTDDTVALSIEYDPEDYPETNGYHGSYLDLYLAEFTSNLQWYLDNLDYARDWTWFAEDGTPLSDEETSALTSEDKAAAFLAGRYTAPSTKGMGPMGGLMMGGMGFPDGALPDGMADGMADAAGTGVPDAGFVAGADGTSSEGLAGSTDGAGRPDGQTPGADGPTDAAPHDGRGGRVGAAPDNGGTREGTPDMDGAPDINGAPGAGDGTPDGIPVNANAPSIENSAIAENSLGDSMIVGTPDAGTTQAAGSSIDSANYASFADMLEEYESDIAEIESGDKYGNNIVYLYNPLNYIGADGTSNPTWVRMLMGAAEGDMSMFTSLNLQLAMLDAGIDANVEWQWNGGHVPSEILSESFALYVDQMYGEYVSGTSIATPAPEALTANGESESPEGTDISSWVDASDLSAVSFSVADAAAYRTAGASKAIPGFDVIDYGQEDYVFGNSERDARHWSTFVLDVLKEHADELEPLFNSDATD